MINNLSNFLLKYKERITLKSEIEEKVINYLDKETNIRFLKKDLKIDIKNKKINLVNQNSSTRFVLKSKIDIFLIEKIKKETGFTLFF